jgi:mono/diheme cytochrome c family protein
MTRILPAMSLVLMAAVAFAAPQRDPEPADFSLRSMSGEDLFNFYCATCHGRDARGGGPVAHALKTEPADLTTLTRRNRGSFPRTEVIAYVDGTGRFLPAHGPGDMPVWGPLFRALEISDPRLRIRIENIVAYIESLQVP